MANKYIETNREKIEVIDEFAYSMICPEKRINGVSNAFDEE